MHDSIVKRVKWLHRWVSHVIAENKFYGYIIEEIELAEAQKKFFFLTVIAHEISHEHSENKKTWDKKSKDCLWV